MEFISQYIPDKLYISGVSALILLIFYLPAVIYYSFKILVSKNIIGVPKKMGILFIFLIAAYVIPLGDVTYYSIAMKKQCPQAGLHIYKQVRVDGFYSNNISFGAQEELLKDKFKFVEGQDYVNGKKEFVRYEIKNNKIIKRVVAEIGAEYEIIMGEWKLNNFDKIEFKKNYIRNKKTNEIIADDIKINPFLGWIDRYVLNLFGAPFLGCGYDRGMGLWSSSILQPN